MKKKKVCIYFLPIIFIHILFSGLDRFFQSKIYLSYTYYEYRMSAIHLGMYFYFFMIPVYLMITNMIFNVRKGSDYYKNDIKLIYYSILISNIVTLFFNIIMKFIYNINNMNCFLEFLLIIVPECVVTAIFSYIGMLLIERRDEDDEKEEELKFQILNTAFDKKMKKR